MGGVTYTHKEKSTVVFISPVWQQRMQFPGIFVSLRPYHSAWPLAFWFSEKPQSGCFHGIVGLRVSGFQIPVIRGLNSRIPTVGVSGGRELISLCTLLSSASRLCFVTGVSYTFKKRCPWSWLAWFKVFKEVNLELFRRRRHKRTSILSFCLPY